MKLLTFEVHTYAPELNKVFCSGININKMFSSTTLVSLTNDYNHNVKIIRNVLKPKPIMKRYRIIATRIDGSVENRFCAQPTTRDALSQLHKARAYYADTTKLDFKIIY